MSFDRLTEAQRLEVTEFMLGEGNGGFAASNGSFFTDTITSFANRQTFNPVAGEEDFRESSSSPHNNFVSGIRRVVDGGEANNLFAYAYLTNEVYGADIDLARLDDEAYLATIQSEFSTVLDGLDNGLGIADIRSNFNLARLDAAEREAALHAQAEPLREMAALAKAAGIELDITDGLSTSEVTAIFDGTNSYDLQVTAGFNYENQMRSTFGTQATITAEAFNPESASALLRHMIDGENFSEQIEEIVSLGADATEAQISYVQAIAGVEVTGKWNEETVTATESYLREPFGADGFQNTLYSASLDTISTSAVIRGLQDGSIPMPTDEQLNSMYEGLADAPLVQQHQAIATWLHDDPSRRAEFGEMIRANHEINPDALVALEALTPVIEGEVTAEIVAEVQEEIIYETVMQNPTLAEEDSPLAEGSIDTTAYGDAVHLDSITPIEAMATHLVSFAGEDGMIDTQSVVMELYYMGQNDSVDFGMMGGMAADSNQLRDLTTRMVDRGMLPEEFDVTDPAQLESALSTFIVANQWYTYGEAMRNIGNPREVIAQASPEWSAEIESVAAKLTGTEETAPEATPIEEPVVGADEMLLSAVDGGDDRVAGTEASVDDMLAEAKAMADTGAPVTDVANVEVAANCNFLKRMFGGCADPAQQVAAAPAEALQTRQSLALTNG
ncbi:MAG: hypothetical protein AAF988_03550 [Pseudomonadota bacterium]